MRRVTYGHSRNHRNHGTMETTVTKSTVMSVTKVTMVKKVTDAVGNHGNKVMKREEKYNSSHSQARRWMEGSVVNLTLRPFYPR